MDASRRRARQVVGLRIDMISSLGVLLVWSERLPSLSGKADCKCTNDGVNGADAYIRFLFICPCLELFVVGATLFLSCTITSATSCSAASSSSSSSSRSMSVPFPSHNWFQDVFGFRESKMYTKTKQVFKDMKACSSDPATKLRWSTNTNTDPPVEVTFGSFSLHSVQDFRDECIRLTQLLLLQQQPEQQSTSRIVWHNIQASVLDLHADPANTGAIFQAASQFNCLEMISPSVTPEDGITDYASDRTQGPACAIACGPGTAYRNYLVEFPHNSGHVGQTSNRQINTLAPILARMTDYNNGEKTKITVRNGYAFASNKKLQVAQGIVHEHADELVGLLQVGVQRNTEVTYPTRTGRLMTQVYCSAVPVSYTSATSVEWAPLARVVLKGAYEATLLEGVFQHLYKQQERPGVTIEPTKIYLTMVGGGAFGNDMEWIWEAMEHANNAIRSYPVALEVYIVHYGSIHPGAVGVVDRVRASSST
eukprot:scaffold287_cov173-Amphora_coffeaeformis.AAC.14